MKKKALISLIVILLCLIPLGFSLAHPTYEGRSTNVITTGEVNIDIEETSDQGTKFVDLDGVMPNTVVSKIVRICNTREQPCWLRVSVETLVEFAEGKTPDPDYQKKISFAIDPKSWVLSEGYYYYRSVLEPGDGPMLFEKVAFAPEMGNEYAKSIVRLTVRAEAVQYKNNEGDGNVLHVKGWPASNMLSAAQTGGGAQ